MFMSLVLELEACSNTGSNAKTRHAGHGEFQNITRRYLCAHCLSRTPLSATYDNSQNMILTESPTRQKAGNRDSESGSLLCKLPQSFNTTQPTTQTPGLGSFRKARTGMHPKCCPKFPKHEARSTFGNPVQHPRTTANAI